MMQPVSVNQLKQKTFQVIGTSAEDSWIQTQLDNFRASKPSAKIVNITIMCQFQYGNQSWDTVLTFWYTI